jgi:hypothetical protein
VNAQEKGAAIVIIANTEDNLIQMVFIFIFYFFIFVTREANAVLFSVMDGMMDCLFVCVAVLYSRC